MRLDVMSVMRGVDEFKKLWKRRVHVEITPDVVVDLLSIQDLVRTKKTQRDKDCPRDPQID